MSEQFVVTIDGYEGIEDMFGPFELAEAIDIVRRFKTVIVHWDDDKRLDNNLYAFFGNADQVCLMARNPVGIMGQMECKCILLPDDLRNEREWLR